MIMTNSGKHRRDVKNGLEKQKDIDGTEHRLCNNCNEWLTLDNYTSIRSIRAQGPRKVGYQGKCKPCSNRYGKRYYKVKKMKSGE